MVSEATRRQVWNSLLDAERLVRYYGDLSDSKRRKHLTVRTILLSAAITGVASFINSDFIPDWLTLFASAAIAIVITVDFVFDFGGKASPDIA